MEHLKESLEEHKANVEVIAHLTKESLENLYRDLVNEVDKALEGEE